MHEPLQHLLRLQPGPRPSDGELLRLVRASDVRWGAPIFRAPALPTPLQMGSELPFTVNFRPKFPRPA